MVSRKEALRVGRISDEDIARVREATDLVALISERVPLRQRGRSFWAPCPFHAERTPSFKVDPETQLWHCFGCGAGGDVFGFVMRAENVEFPEAVRSLAERAGIELTESGAEVPRGAKERLYALLGDAAQFYHRVLMSSRDPGAERARSYLSKRGFRSPVARAWQLGYAPGHGALVTHLTRAGFTLEEMVAANVALTGEQGRARDRFFERIIFPIRDLQGRVVGFGGRVIGSGEPKYLNSSDTPVFRKSQSLYGIDRAKGPITATGAAVVVEGYTDVIALNEAGVTNAVATLGTALTAQHVRLLSRFARRIVYLFDGDEAGMRAAERAAEFVEMVIDPRTGRPLADLRVAALPAGTDPADFVAANGAEAIERVIGGAQPLVEFAIERRLARWDLERPEERARALVEAAAVLAPIEGTLLADDYAALIADRLFANVGTVKRAIIAARSTARPQAVSEGAADGGDTVEAPQLEPAARAARDLLALMVKHPHLRARARRLLDGSLLTIELTRRIAEVIATAPERQEQGALTGTIERAAPGAAEFLSGAPVGEETDEEAERLATDLERRLKEFDLERRIAHEKARLESPEVVNDAALADQIFGYVTRLQRELDELRRSASR